MFSVFTGTCWSALLWCGGRVVGGAVTGGTTVDDDDDEDGCGGCGWDVTDASFVFLDT